MTLGAFLCLEHASVPRKDQSDYMVEQLLVQIEITMQKDAKELKQQYISPVDVTQ